MTSEPETDARRSPWELPAFLLLLSSAAALYLWNLGASGWANAYYSAAALAGSKSWLAMLFGSFDAGLAISVDKTPASLWLMSLSVRLFGLNPWSILVPQSLAGVAAVGLLYLTVRRRFGPIGGLVAGAVLALTPVATLMFRFNNPDALLTLLLVAATYATTRALERASTRWLVVAGACIGFAFLTKMLQGFLVLPAFAGVYLFAAPTSLWRRAWQLGVAALSVAVSAGWWVALVMLWPAEARPYVGGSQTNSIWDLMLGYNGLGRLTGTEVGRVGGGPGPFSEGAGWLRLFQGPLASEVGWLIPASLAILVGLLWVTRRQPRTDPTRAHALLWGGWLVVTGLVFSLMQGIFHNYYAVALVPPIAALLGIGAATWWTHRDGFGPRLFAAGVVGVSSLWAASLLTQSPAWNPWLLPVVLVGGAAATTAILVLPWAVARLGRAAPLVARAALAGSVAVLLAAPAFGSIATASVPHRGAIPASQPAASNTSGRDLAGPGRFQRGTGARPQNGGFGGGPFPGGVIGAAPGVPPFSGGFGGGGIANPFPGGTTLPQAGRGSFGSLLDAGTASPELVAALKDHASDYVWVAATTGSNNAAGLALSSGEAVMAIGGFNGTDPFPTLDEFRADVEKGLIHYYIGGRDAGGFPGARGGSDVAAEIESWVVDNFTETTIGGVAVYDLTGGP